MEIVSLCSRRRGEILNLHRVPGVQSSVGVGTVLVGSGLVTPGKSKLRSFVSFDPLSPCGGYGRTAIQVR